MLSYLARLVSWLTCRVLFKSCWHPSVWRLWFRALICDSRTWTCIAGKTNSGMKVPSVHWGDVVNCWCSFSDNEEINNDLEVAHPQRGSSPTIPGRIGIWKCWFSGRGKNPSIRTKSFRSKGENQQQTHPHMASTQGFEPGPQWLEGSANPLLPIMGFDCPQADLGFLIGGGEKGLLYVCGLWSRSVSGIRNGVHSAQESPPVLDWT